MSTPVRLAAFAVGLGVVFAAAVGVGNAVGSVDTAAEQPQHASHGVEEPDPTPTEAGPAVKGLAVSQDGYTLRLEDPVLPIAEPTTFAFSVIGADGHAVTEFTPTHDKDLHLIVVRRDGRPVDDLQPYLAAYGHLVALRAGDLAYLHVHPEGEPGDGVTTAGPDITFYADVPTGGDFRLYLDFQHDGVVRTAEFTATAQERGTS